MPLTRVKATIIAANTATDVDVVGGTTNSFDSDGDNLIGDGNATGNFNQTGDQTGVSDPGLGPLAPNGGPTETHALLTSPTLSPAIDAVTGSCPPPDDDQRGVERPQGADCDIGAFEQGAPGLTVFGSCPGQVTVAISGASPGGSVALVRGSGPGSFTVLGGPCQGSVLGLEDVQLVTVRTADPNGEFQGTRAVAGSECGIPLQAADIATCTASNVASIP